MSTKNNPAQKSDQVFHGHVYQILSNLYTTLGGNSSKLTEKCRTFILLYLLASPYLLTESNSPEDKESFSVVKGSRK